MMTTAEVVIVTNTHSDSDTQQAATRGTASQAVALASPDQRPDQQPQPSPDAAAVRVDVVVIGGGAAGLSGALVLARARRSVIVVDAGQPRNAPASGVHGFLTRDGIPPAELVAAGQAEVRSYGGQIISGEVVSVTRAATVANGSETVNDASATSGFVVTLADGRTLTARRLLVTTGLIDELPAVPGLRERWGRDVLHCPYCHGWEFQDQPIGILATSPWVIHQALLFRQWSADIVVFTHTAPPLTDEQTEQLNARGIRIVHGRVTGLTVANDQLAGVQLGDGTVVGRRALVVAPRYVARSGALASLGLEPTAHPSGLGEHIKTEPTGQTSVPGVWAAGNVTEIAAQVVGAAAGGVMAAAQINADLVMEETRLAVETTRQADAQRRQADADARQAQARTAALHGGASHQTPQVDDIATLFTQEFWDERYAAVTRVWSGNPNPQLVAQVADLPPGTALDIGCGEGADAIWLASRGWQVTAADVSAVALERAARAAEAAGPEIAARITWERVDGMTWDPAPRQFDLISAQFLHLPGPERNALNARLAAAVRPGGTLLIVGHHPLDLENGVPRWNLPGLLFTAEEIAATLDLDQWETVEALAPRREGRTPDGGTMLVHDAVLRATRRG